MIRKPQIRNRIDTFTNLLTKINDPVHELGWCKDIDCDWEKTK